MWRKQDEPKSSSPGPDLVVPSGSEQAHTLGAQPRESGAAAGNLTSAIRVKGEITGREDLFIDGEVEGSVRLTDGIATVGPNGRVNADIEAREIVIHGTVKGALHGRERVRVGRTGQVAGEVVTRRIAIEEGAIFHGKIDVVQTDEASAPRAAAVAAGKQAFRPVPMGTKESK